MQPFANYFSSPAKYRVLETLVKQPTPIPLRQVAALSKIHVHAAENALQQLTASGVLKRRRAGRMVLFELHSAHKDTSILQDVFRLISNRRLVQAAPQFNQRAKSTLEFITDIEKLEHNARSSSSLQKT